MKQEGSPNKYCQARIVKIIDEDFAQRFYFS